MKRNTKYISRKEADILNFLYRKGYTNQRAMAEEIGYNECFVNRSIARLVKCNYLDDNIQITSCARMLFAENAPRNAIILAAGFGMRMVPINLTSPKALLEVKGERMIDRIIKQLHDAGVTDITVVVGFMKDAFEYLIDEYGVELIVNEKYATSNNLHSLALVAERIKNTYIIPCDIWCYENPFSRTELYSWYMVSDLITDESDIRVNRRMELTRTLSKTPGNVMIGISYLLEPEAKVVRKKLKEMDDEQHSGDFWETVLFGKDHINVQAKVVRGSSVTEINTYEQLRDFDSDSNHLKTDAIHTISSVLKCNENDITNIRVLKKGMTNRSFSFIVAGNKYIMRIPGEGTERLINRIQEAEVYRTISGLGLCDDPVYINPQNGYKITKFLDGVRVCDCMNIIDLELCMDKLRQFHAMKLKVSHTFDVYRQIEFYESLWNGMPSIYQDYLQTKNNIFSLQSFVDKIEKEWCLTHIDAVPDNFLFHILPDGSESLQLTDWEYSGMQDPHVDIAMFCIYSLYNKQQCDQLIDIYFDGDCDRATRTKIYAYIAMCGLLWSNWCEYKRTLGVDFGEYSLRQYRYAKDFFVYAKKMIEGGKYKDYDR